MKKGKNPPVNRWKGAENLDFGVYAQADWDFKHPLGSSRKMVSSPPKERARPSQRRSELLLRHTLDAQDHRSPTRGAGS